MEVLKTRLFLGPNCWSSVRTAELYLQWPASRGSRAASEPTLRERWITWLPALREAAAAAFRVLPDAQRRAAVRNDELATALSGGRSLAEVFALAVRSLQLTCGVDVEFVAIRETDEPGVDLVVVGFEEPALLEGCVAKALRWCDAAARGAAIDAAAELRQLVDLADDARLGPSSLAIVRAAAARRISYRRLGAGSLVQLGEGHLQRRIWTAETDATSAIAETIAQDKQLTKRLLRMAGVPVPLGRAVTSAADAWDAACEIGVPVVVKPRKANHARGVSLNLIMRDEVERAYDTAVEDGDDTGVLVEQFARGEQHRLLVIGGRLVAATRGECEYVVGDGRQSMVELVDAVNRDPRRGRNYTDPLSFLRLDAGALIELARQSLTADSIPAVGQRVLVQHVGDLTTDCTADVHPENAAQAVLAARVVGLDIAGMDVVAEDIRRPFAEQRGAILEVNAGPSLSMHVTPLHGQPQPVGEAVVDLLFPAQSCGRIPLIAVTGTGPRGAVVESIARVWRQLGLRAGRASESGAFVDERRIGDGRSRDAEHFAALVTHPEVEAAVWESHPEQAWLDGLECERVDVAVVLPGTESMPELSWGGIRAVMHAVPPDGTLILPLDAPVALRELATCRGATLLVAGQLDPHRARAIPARGVALIYRDGTKWILARETAVEELPFDEPGFLNESSDLDDISAVAAVWAAGLGIR